MDREGPRVVNVDMGRFKPPKVPTGFLGFAFLGLLLLVLLFNSFFTVQPEEVGVVMTFGKYSKTVEPGLNFKWPTPIQTVIKVPVRRQLKVEFGFQTLQPAVRTRYSKEAFEGESLMLTGDLNVAVVEWTTQYRVDDPYAFLFKVKNLDGSVRRDDTFRAMNEAVMREVIGDRSVNEVLTIGRQEIASLVEERLQELCRQYETGIKIEQVVLQDVNPPDAVKPAFNEVNEAEAEREKLIEQGKADYNSVIPRALGEAKQTIQRAEGYATDRVNRAQGDATAFLAVRAAYRRAPDVTRRRLYLETMAKVLPGVKQKVILDDSLKGILPLLPIATDGGAK